MSAAFILERILERTIMQKLVEELTSRDCVLYLAHDNMELENPIENIFYQDVIEIELKELNKWKNFLSIKKRFLI